MAYEPRSYWPERARKNFGRIIASGHDPRPHTWTDQAAIFRAIAETQPESILDCGCGDGRLFPFLLEANRVVAADPCDEMLDFARKTGYPETHGFELCKLDKYDGTLPFDDDEFDLAVSVSVLLHVLPSQIEHAVRELVRVASNVLVITYYEDAEKELADHNFRHDYPAIFQKLALNVTDFGVDGQRRRWLIARSAETVEPFEDDDSDDDAESDDTEENW